MLQEKDDQTTNGEVRDAISKLLALCGIDHAVLVDDESYEFTTSDVGALVESHRERALEVLGPEGRDIDLTAPVEIWKDLLFERWNAMNVPRRAYLYSRLVALGGVAMETHSRYAPAVRSLLPDGTEAILPTEWTRRTKELVQERISEHRGRRQCRTLVLFDLDLTKADLGEKGGDTLLKALINENVDIDIICGIVSSHTEHYTADDARAGLREGVDADRIVTIDKATLPDAPWAFARGIKKALLAPEIAALKLRAQELIIQANKDAMNEMRTVDLFDLAYALITRSDKEGVFEWETLFRLHRSFLSDLLRRAAITDVKLRALGDNVREVTQTAPGAYVPVNSETWRLQRRDVLDNPEDVNRLHLPIEVGDVFEVETDGNSVQYVLLSPACDLMIRPDGERRLDYGFLVKLSATQSEKKEQPLTSHLIPYYSKEKGEPVRAVFPDCVSAPLWILDLCVFDLGGSATYADGAAPPEALTIGLRERAKDVARRARGVIDAQRRAARKPALPQRVQLASRQLAAIIQKAEVTLNPDSLVIKCKRVQRIKPAYAAELLTRFGHYISRAAFDMDLGVGTAPGPKEADSEGVAATP